jgi:peptidyl-tRNA hydrolase, PTH2 family
MSQYSLVLPYILLGTASAALGYYLGRYTSREVIVNTTNEESVLEDDDDNEDAEGIPDGDLSAISAGLLEPCKMVCSTTCVSPECFSTYIWDRF